MLSVMLCDLLLLATILLVPLRATSRDSWISPGPLSSGSVYDDFRKRDYHIWDYSDHKLYYFDSYPVYYLLNHSYVDAVLSRSEGRGLHVVMSDQPCRHTPSECKGAKMASDHLSTKENHLYGDYEARLRAPHEHDSSKCDGGIYGYFTAGYGHDPHFWNEVNFGFHPDRDEGGHLISCELNADTGGYYEQSVRLPFNYREDFHTFRIKIRKEDVSWWVDGKCIHALHGAMAQLTHPMHTSLILRTNKKGYMQEAIMEWKYFRFTPPEEHHGSGEENLVPNASLSGAELVDWHNRHPRF